MGRDLDPDGEARRRDGAGTMIGLALGSGLAALAAPGLAGWLGLRSRGLDRCFLDYVRDFPRRGPARPGEPVHVLLCIADHYEPKFGDAPPQLASRRVANWVEAYPRLFAGFRDSDGRPPRHTFFYPAEEYEPAYLDELAGLCRAGFGEVEVHLHHHDDTSANLRRTLLEFKETLAGRHGLLARRRDTGEVAYGFIHGNWALDNSRPDGRFCGVNDEIDILRETGCYADFTMPSAPDRCQTRTINRIYYANDDPRRPRSHDRGCEIGHAPPPEAGLMMIQGPLVLDWACPKWRILPRLENGCLQGNQAPSMARLDNWLRVRIQVRSRPDWFFVKLHTHGTQESIQKILLGEPMVQFHRSLFERMDRDPNFHVHYVTAREMYNLAKAAEEGHVGTIAEARDHSLTSNLQSASAVTRLFETSP